VCTCRVDDRLALRVWRWLPHFLEDCPSVMYYLLSLEQYVNVDLKNVPPSCDYCLEILGNSTSRKPKGLSRSVEGDCFSVIMGSQKGSSAFYSCLCCFVYM
jgi:hypothetical protein